MLNEAAAIEYLTQQKNVSKAPVVVMMCGVAGSGKTTFALKLEKAGFVRLSIDEDIWSTHGRFGVDYPEQAYESFKELSEIKLRGELVKLIQDNRHVVIDFSFWQRQKRAEYKQLIKHLGGEWALIHLKVHPDDLRQRLLIRSGRFDANAAFPITEEILTRFLSGFESPAGEGELVIEP
ncbi:AAA family ATPase [Paenibacillus sp. LMG 31459]|uniref:AAA family ATPase n=1 Tax=Paenibacillus phytohabitans TaxID=2654978 RepID=A0ABX1YD81_9BACL|nr:ATP-binding protein [Paenibacillus phytohabitans]NOU77734.1 AAA family ATPase [Paenibacillus phytohabitans]